MSEDVSHIFSGCMVRGLLYNMLCGLEISKQENYGSETHVWPVFGLKTGHKSRGLSDENQTAPGLTICLWVRISGRIWRRWL